jgi:hypothetical protein
MAGPGLAGQGKGHSVGELRIVPAAGECYGRAVNGMVVRGLAMLGKDSFELVAYPRIVARRGDVGRGLARHGAARQGDVRQGLF